MLISRKRHKIATYFQWKSNMKSYMVYRMAPVLVTLNDLEGHSPVAGLFKCNPSNICAVFCQISTDSALARSLSDSWASCSVSHRFHISPYCMFAAHSPAISSSRSTVLLSSLNGHLTFFRHIYCRPSTRVGHLFHFVFI